MNFGFETENVEFKKSTSELKESLVSLASMLNKNKEATLYFGVNDDGIILGQQIGKQTLRDISQAIANYIRPQIIPTIKVEVIGEKQIIEVHCHGEEIPYSCFGKYYIRVADEDRELTPYQLKNIMNVNDDVIIEIESNNQNLAFNQMRTIFAKNNLTLNNDTFLTNLGFLTKKGKYNLMAFLLSDENDISIKVVRFDGIDKTKIIRRNEYGFKNLIIAMDQVLSYVEALNDTKVVMKNHNREEIKLFDFMAFKEAWQNACLHNKWSLLNPPAVYIFDDRIEIISTGGLNYNVSKDSFFKGVSNPVNKRLQKLFGQLNIVEQTGHGVPFIVNKYGKEAFEIMENYINVIIPFNERVIEKKNIEYFPLNKTQKEVIKLLKEDSFLTINDLVNKTSYSNGNVRKVLKQLKDKKAIERIGANKNGYWKVND